MTPELEQEICLVDPRKDERVKIPVPTMPDEFYPLRWTGSSRGWVGIKNVQDSTIRLTNMFNPSASLSSHKVISLPPLYGYNKGPIRIALSSSPNQQDCVVAAFSPPSSFLNLCRPGDSDWTRIKIPVFALEIMYSVRDRKFYLHTDYEEECKGPVDVKCSDFPQVSLYRRFPLLDIPKTKKLRQPTVSTIQAGTYLVESPSGDSFIVKWFEELSTVVSNEFVVQRKPPRNVMVFRQDTEKMVSSYTEDIGDLCIFLSNSEAFCVSATEYPGLKPNSIYFASFSSGFGFYDLSSQTAHNLESPPILVARSILNCHLNSLGCIPYQWLAPLQ